MPTHTDETYTDQTRCPKCLSNDLAKSYVWENNRLALACTCGYEWLCYAADQPEVRPPYMCLSFYKGEEIDRAMADAQAYLLQGGWLKELVSRMIVLREGGFTQEQLMAIASAIGDRVMPEMQAQIKAKQPSESVDETTDAFVHGSVGQ